MTYNKRNRGAQRPLNSNQTPAWANKAKKTIESSYTKLYVKTYLPNGKADN